MKKRSSQFVPEVDGLRAIAILGVILFHLDFNVIKGGFVGVDIFFVISGFLITRIIVTEIESTGSFDYRRFYLRRARRLMPAMLVTLFLTLLASLYIFSAYDLNNFLSSLIYSIFSLSNIFFYMESGYFDTAADLKPLLHTWSLSVEEQFYIIWPALMAMLLYRLKTAKSLAWAILILSVASFYLNYSVFTQGAWLHDLFLRPDSAMFYMMPFRIFEFGMGAILVYLTKFKINNIYFVDIIFLLGLVLIIHSMLTLGEGDVFPYYNALLPCLGAALIIYVSGQSRLKFLIANRIFLFIGVISYSLYLVHWPMIVFLKYNGLDNFLSIREAVSVLVLSFILAAIMYRLIEKPFRYMGDSSSNKRFVVAIVMLVGVFVSYSSISYDNTVTNKISVERFEKCKDLTMHSLEAECRVWGSGDKTVIFWGDSHVLALFQPGMPKILSGYKVYIIGHTGCPPLVGVVRDDKTNGNAGNCDNKGILTSYAEQIKAKRPDALFLVGRWSLYTNGWRPNGKLHEASHFISEDEDVEHRSSEHSKQVFARAFKNTLKYFSDIDRVFVIKSVPTFSHLGRAPQLVKKGIKSIPISDYLSDQSDTNSLIDDALLANDIVIDPARILCTKTECKIADSGKPIYMDDNHLNAKGVQMFWQSFGKLINEKLAG